VRTYDKAAYILALQDGMAAYAQSVEHGYRRAVRMSVKDFRELTSGDIPAKTLRRLGYPYAVDGSGPSRRQRLTGKTQYSKVAMRGRVPYLPVNKQTGRLQRSGRLKGPTGPDKRYELRADAPYLPFVLFGTRSLMARRFDKVIQRRFGARWKGIEMALGG
jgi:hypothetical protein